MSFLRINYVAIQLCKDTFPNTAKIYLFKISNRNTRKRPDICYKLQKDVTKNVLVSSLLTLSYFTHFPSFSIIDFKQVNVCWENYQTFYSFDTCFNVPTGGRQDLTRSNVGNSIFFFLF